MQLNAVDENNYNENDTNSEEEHVCDFQARNLLCVANEL